MAGLVGLLYGNGGTGHSQPAMSGLPGGAGRAAIPVLVDTGSNGLVIPLQDIGFQHLGLPTGLGTGDCSGGLVYVYATFHTTVDFGNRIVSAPTDVNIVIFSFPTTFHSFIAGNGADGVLGIGPNATGPSTSNPTTALPGDLKHVC